MDDHLLHKTIQYHLLVFPLMELIEAQDEQSFHFNFRKPDTITFGRKNFYYFACMLIEFLCLVTGD